MRAAAGRLRCVRAGGSLPLAFNHSPRPWSPAPGSAPAATSITRASPDRGAPRGAHAMALVAGAAAGAAAAAAASATPGPTGSGAGAAAPPRVTVFSTPACKYCKRAKQALDEAGVGYVDVDVSGDDGLRAALRLATDSRTVPQVFVCGRHVGGSDDLLAAMASGAFAAALAEAGGAAGAGLPAALAEAVAAAAQRAAASPAGGGAAAASPAGGADPRLQSLARRLAAPAEAGGIARASQRLGPHTIRAFTPADLIAWLRAAGEADAAATARALLDARLVVQPYVPYTGGGDSAAALAAAEAAEAAVDAALAAAGAAASTSAPAALLMLRAEAPPPVAGEPLNAHYRWRGSARPADQVAASLRSAILALYDAHLSPDGRAVSYGALRSDPAFAAYVDAAAELQKVDLSALPRAALLAFGINTYNALVVHALVALRLTRMSPRQRATFYSRTALYDIGGLPYTADDLENGLLRGNRAGASHVANLLGLHGLAGGHWPRHDPRARTVVAPPDPRIHFALVCGAKSCPPIRTYDAARLEEGLAAAAEAFCGAEVAVDAARREVVLSRIFKWYAIDFGTDKASRLRYVASQLPAAARGQLEALLAGGGDVRVSYSEYDWSLNGTD